MMEVEVISWNLTRACNLSCSHCYLPTADRGEKPAELSTAECLKVIDQIEEVASQPLLILTGGEPLLREDILDIARYAGRKKITLVLGTNGTKIDEPLLSRLEESGVQGLGISLDSLRPEVHDSLRGVSGAWQRTMAAVELADKKGFPFTIQTTVLRDNRDELPALADFSYKAGARVHNIFFLVCTGRGQEMTDISPEDYEETLGLIVELEKGFAGRMLIKAKCAPHVNRIRYEKGLWRPEEQKRGCPAGTGYLRITAEGKVTPCPYIPWEVGDLKKETLSRIWERSSDLKLFRQWNLKGRCGRCEFISLCGGCRARALASAGDVLSEDPWCRYEPGRYDKDERLRPGQESGLSELSWEVEARERLKAVPAFVRRMVEKRVEEYARARGFNVVSIEVLGQVREKYAGSFSKGR